MSGVISMSQKWCIIDAKNSQTVLLSVLCTSFVPFMDAHVYL